MDSSCFGSSSLFILTKVNVYTLALLPVLCFLTGHGAGCIKSQFFPAKGRLQLLPAAFSLSCPLQSLQSWKLQHQPHHRVKRAPGTRGGTTCLSQSAVKHFIGSLSTGVTLWKAVELFQPGTPVWQRPQGLRFRGTGDAQQILPVVVICHCCWNQCLPCLLPQMPPHTGNL